MSGGVYPVLAFVLLFLFIYSCIVAVQEKNIRPLKMFIFCIILIILFGAVKLLPMVEFCSKHHIIVQTKQYNTFATMFKAFFSRNQVVNYPRDKLWAMPLDVSFWEQRGAYIGVIPFIVYLASIKVAFKKNRPLLLAGVIFLILSTISIFPIGISQNIGASIAQFLFHYFSRFVWMFVFSLALIAGLGMSSIERKAFSKNNIVLKKVFYSIFIYILIYVLVDLISVNRPIFQEAFLRPPEKVKREDSFIQLKKDNVYFESKIYPTILANQGLCVDNAIIYEKNLSLCNAVSFGSKRYRANAYLKDGRGGEIEVLNFSPNKITIRLSTKKNDRVILNQNYDPNWKVSGLEENKVTYTDGLLSAPVGPQDRNLVTFYYFPCFFYIGVIISISSLVSVVLYKRRVIKNRIFIFTVLFWVFIFCSSCMFILNRYSYKPDRFYTVYKEATQGIIDYRNNNFGKAISHLENGSKYFPNSIILHQILKECYETVGRKQMAVLEEKHIQELAPAKVLQ